MLSSNTLEKSRKNFSEKRSIIYLGGCIVSALISYEHTPLTIMLENMRADENSFLRNEEKRRDLCLAFWINTVIDEEANPNIRMRASELLAKANGQFVEKKELTLLGGYREMVMNAKGKLVELNPLHRNSLESADAMEYIEYEVT